MSLFLLFINIEVNINVYVFHISDIKSRYDEEKSMREMLEQRLANLNQDLQREKQEKEKLAAELVMSPLLSHDN